MTRTNETTTTTSSTTTSSTTTTTTTPPATTSSTTASSTPDTAVRGTTTPVTVDPGVCWIDGDAVTDYVLVDPGDGTTDVGALGCSRPTSSVGTPPTTPATLPATGVADVAGLALAGAVLIACGIGARRVGRRAPD